MANDLLQYFISLKMLHIQWFEITEDPLYVSNLALFAQHASNQNCFFANSDSVLQLTWWQIIANMSVILYSTLELLYELLSHRIGVEYPTILSDLYSMLAIAHANILICMNLKMVAGWASDDPFDLGMSDWFSSDKECHDRNRGPQLHHMHKRGGGWCLTVMRTNYNCVHCMCAWSHTNVITAICNCTWILCHMATCAKDWSEE